MKFTLGSTDAGAIPANLTNYFARYHNNLKGEPLLTKIKFRDEGTNVWQDFQELPGTGVRDFQQFLKDSGFMPKSTVDGIFGYETHAATRLFQEYIRNVQGDVSIGVPDGVAGPNTLGFVEKWKQAQTGICDWGKYNAQTPSQEFTQWMELLAKAKNYFITDRTNPIVQHVENYKLPSDTRKPTEWDVSPDTVHLIGLRRSQDAFAGTARRENDDLFVLLIKGMVFKFWGSTDPNPGIYDEKKKEKRDVLPFLVESQHSYQFGWHKLDEEEKVYRALRPASNGVLVFRDKDKNRALTNEDIVKGLDAQPNNTINIHWSGHGNTNFSAGCQVIAGRSYINHKGDLINCSAYAAGTYDELGSQKTRAAYNVLTDLLLTYGASGVRTIAYLLGRDETLRLSDIWKENQVGALVDQLKRV